MYKGLIIASIILLFSCKQEVSKTLKVGTWRAELKVLDNEILPFNFEVTSAHSLKLFNGDDRITSYNVCYTKLLRIAFDVPLLPFPAVYAKPQALSPPPDMPATRYAASFRRGWE